MVSWAPYGPCALAGLQVPSVAKHKHVRGLFAQAKSLRRAATLGTCCAGLALRSLALTTRKKYYWIILIIGFVKE